MNSVIVTAQEVTDKLAVEIGILTVNNFMQTLQIEKMHKRIESDEQVISHLNNTLVTQTAEIVKLNTLLNLSAESKTIRKTLKKAR